MAPPKPRLGFTPVCSSTILPQLGDTFILIGTIIVSQWGSSGLSSTIQHGLTNKVTLYLTTVAIRHFVGQASQRYVVLVFTFWGPKSYFARLSWNLYSMVKCCSCSTCLSDTVYPHRVWRKPFCYFIIASPVPYYRMSELNCTMRPSLAAHCIRTLHCECLGSRLDVPEFFRVANFNCFNLLVWFILVEQRSGMVHSCYDFF